ncbi:hypothetical protein BBJ28_00014170 [Nothophytophthora sp. Chile5]|nr:hypothetical protein BBJ28_00014170 [Nothophytophthora sp. Chile5]
MSASGFATLLFLLFVKTMHVEGFALHPQMPRPSVLARGLQGNLKQVDPSAADLGLEDGSVPASTVESTGALSNLTTFIDALLANNSVTYIPSVDWDWSSALDHADLSQDGNEGIEANSEEGAATEVVGETISPSPELPVGSMDNGTSTGTTTTDGNDANMANGETAASEATALHLAYDIILSTIAMHVALFIATIN